jgi:hypothetical protein
MTITTEQYSTQASDFFDAVTDLTERLYGRWLDEKDYEDINDYRAPVQQIADGFGVTIVKMTKRPFGFHFSVDGRTFAMTVNTRSISYKRIA